MDAAAETFSRHVGTILDRFWTQNRAPKLPAEVRDGIATRLWSLVRERGLPPPLPVAEKGDPGEMTPEEVAPLIARVVDGVSDPLLDAAARQLVKACFQPEFRTCRESYHEADDDGTVRRQELKRACQRISGSHCVDCPYWLSLSPEQHATFLRKQWREGRAADFDAHRGLFLPEDFRALRRFVRELAQR